MCGGGSHDCDSAAEMSAHGDVIVVGELVHEQGVEAGRETVAAAKDAPPTSSV